MPRDSNASSPGARSIAFFCSGSEPFTIPGAKPFALFSFGSRFPGRWIRVCTCSDADTDAGTAPSSKKTDETKNRQYIGRPLHNM